MMGSRGRTSHIAVALTVAFLVVGPVCTPAHAFLSWGWLYRLLFSHLPFEETGIPEGHYQALCEAVLDEYAKEPTQLTFVQFIKMASLAEQGQYRRARRSLAPAPAEPVADMLRAKLTVFGAAGDPNIAEPGIRGLVKASGELRSPIIACSTALDAANFAHSLPNVDVQTVRLATETIGRVSARLPTAASNVPGDNLLRGALWKGTSTFMMQADLTQVQSVGFARAFRTGEALLRRAETAPGVQQAASHELGDMAAQLATAGDRWVIMARPGVAPSEARRESYSQAHGQWGKLSAGFRSEYLTNRINKASVALERG